MTGSIFFFFFFFFFASESSVASLLGMSFEDDGSGRPYDYRMVYWLTETKVKITSLPRLITQLGAVKLVL